MSWKASCSSVNWIGILSSPSRSSALSATRSDYIAIRLFQYIAEPPMASPASGNRRGDRRKESVDRLGTFGSYRLVATGKWPAERSHTMSEEPHMLVDVVEDNILVA